MSSHTSSSRNEHRTILLVEDEPFVRDATQRILQNAGFEVITAANAQEAIAAYEKFGTQIDLLMSDVVLPGRSGLQLVGELRLRCSTIAVLLTSGYGEHTTTSDSLGSDTYYLPKPYSRQVLVEKIEQISRGRACQCEVTQAS